MACTPVFLTEADRCNTSIVICSGRYTSLALAEAACVPTSPPPPPPPAMPCCPGAGPYSVNATVHMPTGIGSVGADYTVPLIGNTASRTGDWTVTGGGGKGTLTIACAGDEWTYSLTQDANANWPGGVIASGTLEVVQFGTAVYGNASGTLPAPHALEGEAWGIGTTDLCGGSPPTL